jgi:hypothetical protein
MARNEQSHSCWATLIFIVLMLLLLLSVQMLTAPSLLWPPRRRNPPGEVSGKFFRNRKSSANAREEVKLPRGQRRADLAVIGSAGREQKDNRVATCSLSSSISWKIKVVARYLSLWQGNYFTF